MPLAEHLADLLPRLCVVARAHEVPGAGTQDAVAVDPDGNCVLLTLTEHAVTRIPDDLTSRWAWFAEHRDELPTRFPRAGFVAAATVHAALIAPDFAPRLIRALELSPLADLHLIRVRGDSNGDGGEQSLGALVEDALYPSRPVHGAEPAAVAPPEVTAFHALRPLGPRELETRCAHRLARLDPGLIARRDGDTTRFVLRRQTVATLLQRADHLELAVPGSPPFPLRRVDDLDPALLSATRRYFDLLAPAARGRPRRRGLARDDLIDDG